MAHQSLLLNLCRPCQTIAYILEHNDYPRSKGLSTSPSRHSVTTSTTTIVVGDEDGKPPAKASSSSSSGRAASSSSSSSSAMDVSYQIQERNRKLERKADEYRSSTVPTSDDYKQLAIHHLTLLFPTVNMVRAILLGCTAVGSVRR